ncbi:MAG: VWA domain-containing protein [Propionibacteriaceae bacterium]|nr:VWA domain-containing protein [Propionibacteriaceae bacterium]
MSDIPRRSAGAGDDATSRRKPVIAAIATVAVLAIGAGAWALASRTSDASDTAGTQGTGSGCPTAETIAVDPSVAAVLTSAATRYAESLPNADCDPITVESTASQDVATNGLSGAAAWVPEDKVWQNRATGNAAALGTAPAHTLGWSPTVVVTQAELAEALDGEDLTTFADYGERNWGRLKLVMPAPAESVTGAVAFSSLARQVADGQNFPTSAASATAEQQLMPSVEWRTVAQPAPAEVVNQLDADPADAASALGVGPRVGLTTEAVALTTESDDLRVWHLDGGRSGVTVALIATDGNPTIDGFRTWLTGPDGQGALLEAGLRVGDRAPSAERLAHFGLPPEGISEPAEMNPLTWGITTQVYAAFSHRSNTLTALDTSGSMGERLGSGNQRKVDLITQAAADTWSLWPPGSVTGLMTFNAEDDGTPVFREVIPLQLNNTPEYLAEMPRHTAQFTQIQTQGGTPLYEGIWRAYTNVNENYRPEFTNTVVVLTDGRNEDSTSTMTVDQLISQIKDAQTQHPNRRINLGLVALGAEADYGNLKRIADETGNRAWLVQDPADVPDVLPAISIAFAN